MKDLVDIFEDQDRLYNGRWGDDQKRCSFCRQYFDADELISVGEHVIDGNIIPAAMSCSTCLSEEDQY